ncbi:MAG: hypothetical protein DRH89_03465 [Candidatus Cloacimonadota bacterium]|nr:MAG: hypothetical protein DRH89_03465 [Candidatus Cloacimonadota bacterium]HHD82549.1 hypothetical protein [Bacteroidota bacterium]
MKSNNIYEQKNDLYMLRINKGEKIYKIFIFRPKAGKDRNFEYRILTKEMKNGLLELVSYNYKIVDNIPQKYSITRASDINKKKIKSIISNVLGMTNTSAEEFEEIDLSIFDTIEEQIKFLEKRDRINKEFIM